MLRKNIGINDKFWRKVTLLRYTEWLKFSFKSWKAASKQTPHHIISDGHCSIIFSKRVFVYTSVKRVHYFCVAFHITLLVITLI